MIHVPNKSLVFFGKPVHPATGIPMNSQDLRRLAAPENFLKIMTITEAAVADLNDFCDWDILGSSAQVPSNYGRKDDVRVGQGWKTARTASA